MNRYYVVFECWSPDNFSVVSPSTWSTAETPEHAEQVARKRLGKRVHEGLAMTTCVLFSEEDYQKEQARLKEYYKRRGCDEWGRDPSLN